MNRRQLLGSMAGASGFFAAASLAQATDTLESKLADTKYKYRQDFLDTEYGQIYYWSAGTGVNVVCIHQSGNSSQEYQSLVPLLAGKCRLISLDLPGHGRSDDPKSEPTVEDYTTAVIRVLDHLGIDKAHVVGHHGGALTAMNLAATQPERFDKKILSGTGGLKTPEQTQKFMDSILSIDTSIRADTDFISATWERYIEMMSDGAEVKDIVRPFVAFLEARLKPYRSVLVNLKWDRGPALKKLSGPVLLVQGTKDSYLSGQESLLDIIPGSTRIVMEGCGTFMFYDKPKECAQLLADYFEI